MATSINTKFGALALGRGPLVKNQPLAQGKAAQAQQPNTGQDAVKLSLSSANIRGVASGGGNSGQSYVGIRNALTQPNGSRQPGLSQGQASALKGKPGLSEPGSSGLFREGATISGKISELDLTPNSSGALEFNLKDGNENYNVSVQGNVGFAKNEATGEISTFRVALSGDSYTFSDVKNLAPSTSSTSEAYKGVESGNGSVDFGGFSLQFGEGGQIQFSLNNDQLGSLTGQGYYDESQGVFVLSFSNGATLSGSLERAEGGGFTLSLSLIHI